MCICACNNYFNRDGGTDTSTRTGGVGLMAVQTFNLTRALDMQGKANCSFDAWPKFAVGACAGARR